MKSQITRQVLKRVLDAGVPYAWTTVGEVYGGDLHLELRVANKTLPMSGRR